MSNQEEITKDVSEDTVDSEEETIAELYGFIAQEMQAGVPKSDIAKKVEETGVEKEEAKELTESITKEITSMVQKEEMTPISFGLGILGGTIGAIIGGAIWGGLIIGTGYEIGYVAWGIGFLSGYAVLYSAMGRKGLPLQMVAVVSSMCGILLGKYVLFYDYLKQSIAEEHGAEAVNQISMMSGAVIQYFGENITTMVSAFDLLWVALAIGTAWYIPKSSGIKLPIEYKYA